MRGSATDAAWLLPRRPPSAVLAGLGSAATVAVFLAGVTEPWGDFGYYGPLAAAGLCLFAFGLAWGSPVALVVLAACAITPAVAFDFLYFVLDFNPTGYCQATAENAEPCDPGPLPASIALFLLPVPAAICAAGVLADLGVRRLRGR